MGYNAQAVTNEHEVVLAAEVLSIAPDFGQLGPMLDATQFELDAAGVTERPGVLLADTGCWHHKQMECSIGRGIEVLMPPTPASARAPGAAGQAAVTLSCAESSPPTTAARFIASVRR